MIQEPFANWNSLIHRLDLRIKVVFATIYSFIVVLSMRFPTLLGALFISFECNLFSLRAAVSNNLLKLKQK